MISRLPLLTLFALVLAPGLLSAQQQPLGSEAQEPQNSTVIKLGRQINYDRMYEDIEIMRRILDRKLTPLYTSVPSKGVRTDPFGSGTPSPTPYGSTGTLLVTPEAQYKIEEQWIRNANPGLLPWSDFINQYPATIPLRSLEGVYLKGPGVIYTATLASLQPPAKAEADSSIKEWRVAILQPDSEWDSIRRQVRSEKETPKKPEESKPPSLSDVLLKVLAENGHHFSQLGENESLTIVLTVHEAERQLPARKTTGKSSAASAQSGSQEAKSTAASEVSDLELLGDLHQKQGHYEEALKAFGRAVACEPGPSPNVARRLYRKMAQCYLALEQEEKAQRLLNEFRRLTQGSANAQEKPAADAKPVAALPVKLIISAPKKLLDQVKEGKITFEDFRRQARVETLRFGDRR